MTIEFEKLDEPNLAGLRGRLDILESIVREMVFQMPERAMLIISHHASRAIKDADEDMRRTDSDLRRDYAAGVYEVAAPLIDHIHEHIDDLQEGSRIRTIQPFPIAKANWIDKRGF